MINSKRTSTANPIKQIQAANLFLLPAQAAPLVHSIVVARTWLFEHRSDAFSDLYGPVAPPRCRLNYDLGTLDLSLAV